HTPNWSPVASVHKPRLAPQRAKQPEAPAGLRLHQVVIAAHVLAAPPARFDAFWAPGADDDVVAALPAKTQRRPAGVNRCRLDPLGRRQQARWSRRTRTPLAHASGW